MGEIIFKADAVTKTYKYTKAIDNASFEIEKGKIYGFIGQNGAGKTTFIRIITGMAKPNSGSISLFGATDEKSLVEARKKIGAIIESPAFYPTMTAEENIRIRQLLYGIKDEEQIKELLGMVGLLGTEKKKAKDFSLGMRQRLSIALALVNNPEFLVLDEPINGLDPVGIKEVRDLIIRLNKERGITVLISSHILSELYQLATDYVIIHRGRILQELTLEELENNCKRSLNIRVDDVPRAMDILNNRFGYKNITVYGNLISVFGQTDVETVARTFMDEKILVTELVHGGESLESYYMGVIGGAENGQTV